MVRRRLASGAAGVVKQTPSFVVLETGEGEAVTLSIADGEVSARAGTARDPTTRVIADAATLVSVVEGTTSGVEAFLDDRLRVRGNLALALQLDGLFEPGRHRPARFPRSGSVRAGGVRTVYLEAGPPDGPAVLVLHGLAATNASMLPTAWELARDHRVIAPDLPGHGASSAPRATYDARFFARWAAALLDGLGVSEAVVVGNSLGGRIALEIALEHPERVRGLVLLAPAVAFRRLRQLVPLMSLFRPEMGLLPLPLTRAMAARGLPLLFARPERAPTNGFHAAADEFARVYRHRRHRVALLSAVRAVYLDDAFGPQGFWRRLPTMRTPALFVWGRRDRLVPAAFARHVTEALPQAVSVVLDDCGHVPQFELPEQTHAQIRRFLAALAGEDRFGAGTASVEAGPTSQWGALP